MFCFRYIIVNTVHKGENMDDDDDNNKQKKQVALIMLIIALQFDVSMSFNM